MDTATFTIKTGKEILVRVYPRYISISTQSQITPEERMEAENYARTELHLPLGEMKSGAIFRDDGNPTPNFHVILYALAPDPSAPATRRKKSH